MSQRWGSSVILVFYFFAIPDLLLPCIKIYIADRYKFCLTKPFSYSSWLEFKTKGCYVILGTYDTCKTVASLDHLFKKNAKFCFCDEALGMEPCVVGIPKYIPANIYLFKGNNRNTRKRHEICSNLTIKKPEQRHLTSFFWCFYW